MTESQVILVADRNPNVCNLIRRELTADGFRVHTVSTAKDLLRWLSGHQTLSALILDPDLPDSLSADCFREIGKRGRSLQLLIHAQPDDCRLVGGCFREAVHIHKSADSVENMRRIIHRLLDANK